MNILFKIRAIFPTYLILIIIASTANAIEQGSVYIPLTFHTETKAIRTSACLKVFEYTNNKNWAGIQSSNSKLESQLILVLNAIKQNDSKVFFEMAHTLNGRDSGKLKQQEEALFEQFKEFKIESVPYYYKINDLVIFYVKLKYASETLFTPFIFQSDVDGVYRFLPYRTDDISYILLKDWFNASWGPAKNLKPKYCSEKQAQEATHSINLSSVKSSKDKENNANLYFTGSTVESVANNSFIAKKLNRMKANLKNKGINSFVAHISREGGNRLKEWYLSVGKEEKNRYFDWFVDQKPLFIIDASPIIVLYTKASSGLVQVLYFVRDDKNRLLWVNSSHITEIDKVFKHDPLFKSSTREKPFDDVEINLQ